MHAPKTSWVIQKKVFELGLVVGEWGKNAIYSHANPQVYPRIMAMASILEILGINGSSCSGEEGVGAR